MGQARKPSGYIESLQIGQGFAVVRGWVGYRQGPTIEGEIRILLNGEHLATISGLDYRADLDRAEISGGHAGFCVAGKFELASAEKPVLALTLENGTQLEFSGESLDPAPFQPQGFIETVGPEGIVGWLFDPAMAFGHGQAHLVLNEKHQVPIELNRDRFDLPFRADSDYFRWGFALRVEMILAGLANAPKHETSPISASDLKLALVAGGQTLAVWSSKEATSPNTAGAAAAPEASAAAIEATPRPQEPTNGSERRGLLALRPNLIRHPPAPVSSPSQSPNTSAVQQTPQALSGLGPTAKTADVPDSTRERSPTVPAAAHAERRSSVVTHYNERGASGSSMLVVSWDMGHNPVGRAFLLADMAALEFDPTLTGPLFKQYGTQLWPPLRDEKSIKITTFEGGDFPTYLRNMLAQVEATDAQSVYVSKARLPSLLFGILMRVVKGSALIVDIDDHELSFFPNKTELTLEDALKYAQSHPDESAMPYAEVWTRLAENLVRQIGAITVSNVALQARFGGVVVRHGRNEEAFRPDPSVRERVRAEFGLAPDDVAVLFVGTPRPHKGIYRIAEALERLNNDKLVFVVVGSFTDARTKDGFKRFKKARIKFFENQPWERLPEIVSMADLVAILQDPASPIAEYQIPAKLTDALALGIPVFATRVPPLLDLIAQGTIEPIDTDMDLDRVLSAASPLEQSNPAKLAHRRQRFLSEFSYKVNASRIKLAYEQAVAEARDPVPAPLKDAVYQIAKHFGVSHPLIERCAPVSAPAVHRPDQPFDLVFFWKQNDTDIYGRRSDMMIKYLLKSGRVRRVLQFDRNCTLGELERNVDRGPHSHLHQGNLVYVNTVRRALKMADTPQVIKRTFICRDGSAPQRLFGTELPRRSDYMDFVRTTLNEVGMDSSAAAWVCPVVMDFPQIQEEFRFSRIIADIIDDQRKWKAVPDYMRRVEQNYVDVLKMSDLVVANCEPVKEGFRDLRDDIVVVPNGAEEFEPNQRWPIPADIAHLPRPIVGYVGNLRDRIDLPLIEKIATQHPDWSIVLIGSAHDAIDLITAARQHPNIHLMGVRPYEEALAYIKNFDVAMMPHLDNVLSQNMNPLKLYVYFALGVPIVTSEVANIGDIGPKVAVARTHEQFLAAVEAAVSDPQGLDAGTYRDVISSVSWRKRVADVFRHLDATA
jgi:glycosyltransferase involved in cell wall biosynthesis